MTFLEHIKSLFVWNDFERDLLAESGDSQLIKKHSSFVPINIISQSINLRVVNIPHPKPHKSLPNLPLVVFIHGLGGQLNQFEYLIDYFSYFSHVVALDLPGHGQSDIPNSWDIYRPESLVNIIEKVILMLSDPQEQEVVLIGHSMGTQLAVRLAHHLAHRMSSAPAAENFIMSESDSGPKSLVCVGLVAICPPAHVDPKIEALKQKLYYLPPLIFDVFRSFDRVGGLDSKSVTRLVDPKASEEVRSQQLRINLQVNTKAWIRTAYGFETVGSKEWASLQCPIYLIGARQDHVIPCDHVLEIHSWFDKSSVSASIQPVIVNDAGHSCMIEKYQLLCGLVGDFVSKKVDSHLSLAWQLAFLASQSDKWSLKNEQKWRSVQPVGDRVMIPGDNVSVVSTPYSNSSVIDTRVRGMKTLRENDSSHSPQLVEQQYPDIYHIVDISRDQPPYDPSTFKRIKYHKFPTVSKVPPSRKEVKQFNELVDDCLAKTPHNGCLAVHCHYGFNRTGFFICAYLIERYNATVTVAVEAFKRSRSPGIKHPHFVDELYVRYELGGNNRRVSTSL